jgi:hypothetical protein
MEELVEVTLFPANSSNMEEALFEHLANIYNQMFEKNQSIDRLLEGILVVLNKPNKPIAVKDTRPITLLNMVRKMLSTIVLRRIAPAVDTFLSPSQSGFRAGRQTTDVIWTYRWLQGSMKRFADEFPLWELI